MSQEEQFQGNDQQDFFASFDVEKFKLIFLKSWIIILIFLAITVTTSYLYVRYTPPTYESSSVIKLNFASEASMLNISSPIGKGGGDISGEIELLKSRLFFSKVVEAIDMDVSYYRYGRILDGERFRNSPFKVTYELKGRLGSVDIEILENGNFRMTYGSYSGEHRFDEKIVRPEFEAIISKTKFFNESAIGRYYFKINSPQSQVDFLKGRVSVVPESFSAKTLRISIQTQNQLKGQVLVQTIDSIYEIYTREAKNQALEQKIRFLNERIQETEKILGGYEEYFENFIIENRTTNLRNDLNRTIEGLVSMDSTGVVPEVSLSEILLLKEAVNSDEPIVINELYLEKLPRTVSELLKNYRDSFQERAIKRSSYGENTFVMQRLDDKIELLKTRLLLVLDAYHQNLIDGIQNVEKRKNRLERSLNELPSLETEYGKNRRFYSQQEQFMLMLRRAKMDIEITRAGTVTDIVVLSPASYPYTHIKPKETLIYGLGVISGLMIGILFLLIRYLIDNKITSVSELERLLSVPILGSIPFYKQEKLINTKLVIKKDSKSSLSESLRTIRTNMEFMNGTSDKHVISVSSTVSGEGKTFVGVNLGGIIALSGQKVCVVDLDMRKPKIHLAFDKQENSKGVSTILSGKSKALDSVTSTAIENLFYLPAGPIPPNPSELLLGDLFDKLLSVLQKEFDVVILDTPPVGLVTDGILVMKKADLQLYVVRSGYSKRGYVKTIENLKKTNQFNKLTVIFNSLKGSGSYGYGYGYGHGYGYYEDNHKK